MSYELFDAISKNCIGYFDTREEALEEVRCAIADYGVQWADSIILGEVAADGHRRMVVRGAELAQLALATAEARRAS